jgi:hypothetical protein
MHAVARHGQRLHRLLINEFSVAGHFWPPLPGFFVLATALVAVTLFRWVATALRELTK